MAPLAILFLFVTAAALLVLPRPWAPLPLLAGACYMTIGQGIQIGPFNFHFIRLVIAVGVFRVVVRQEGIGGRLMQLDWVMMAWGAWAICTSAFYIDPLAALVFRMGIVYNHLGVYFLIRIFCRETNDILLLAKIIGFILAPVALEMISEQVTGRNAFAIFGRVSEMVIVRSERLRAQGPFAHAILAGTVGAACLPMMIGVRRFHPAAAKVGIVSCIAMAVASASSGPLVSIIFGLFALALWRCRGRLGYLRGVAVLVYGVIQLTMDRPAYFIIQKLDLTGSSTGWHRAELIRSTFAHFDEWWLAGTNYTRHWMPTGVSWSTNHTDITNHYIHNGVQGGVLLMALFGYSVWVAFRYVGRIVATNTESGIFIQRFAWSLGACLFAHAASCVSVAYFDQSFVFLYLTLAVIGSLYQATTLDRISAPTLSPVARRPVAEPPDPRIAAGHTRFCLGEDSHLHARRM